MSAKISEDTLSSEAIKVTIAVAIKNSLEPITVSIDLKHFEELKKPIPSAAQAQSEVQQFQRSSEKEMLCTNPTRYIMKKTS